MLQFHTPPTAVNPHGLNTIDEAQCEAVHQATLEVLADTGVRVEDPEARALFADHGADVDEAAKRVRLSPDLVNEAIAYAPSQLTLTGRDPACDVVIGNGRPAYCNFGAQVKVIDPESGRVRPCTKADVAAAARLCDALPEVDFLYRAVHAIDYPPTVCNLHTAEAVLHSTTKPCFVGPENAWETRACIAMATAAAGGPAAVAQRPPLAFVTAVTSPLTLTWKFCEVVRTAAEAGFTTAVVTLAMGGASAPATIAGTMVMTNAELLAGLTLVQLVRRGANVLLGSYSTCMDLRIGSAPLGCPETAQIGAAMARLYRFYDLPLQVPGLAADGKSHGSQTAHEKTLTGMAAAFAGAGAIVGMGDLESGLTFDFGQLVLDAEFVRMIRWLTSGIVVDPTTLAVDVIAEIGPQGNFLGHDSTFDRMDQLSRGAFIDRRSRDDWQISGGADSYVAALSQACRLLEEHRPTPLPESAAAEIRAILEQAEKEKGASPIRTPTPGVTA